MTEPIVFIAEIYKVQTLVDNGIRITLNLPETAILAAAQLMECKRLGVAGDVTYTPMVTGDDTPQEWSPK